MKSLTILKCKARASRPAMAGYTLIEMMFTLAIFIFVVGGMISVQVFGLRVYTLAATKITATTSGREALNAIRDQIRSSKEVYVGMYTGGIFTPFTNNSPRIGNAVQIFSTTNQATPNFLVVYQNPASNTVLSQIGNAGTPDIVASYMTNYYCFQAQDCFGGVITNNINSPVICMEMHFFQWEYPIGFVGTNGINAYDYYYLRTKISRRAGKD
jgi:Tfp pilus assembly protein PilW